MGSKVKGLWGSINEERINSCCLEHTEQTDYDNNKGKGKVHRCTGTEVR